MAVLTLGEHFGQGLMQIKDIAASKDIPRQYLEQIFNRLVNGGIVRSVRGKKGGYQLADEPTKITVLNVIEILEGGIQLAPESGSPPDAIHELFQQTEKKLRDNLDISLSDLISKQQQLRQNVMFHI